MTACEVMSICKQRADFGHSPRGRDGHTEQSDADIGAPSKFGHMPHEGPSLHRSVYLAALACETAETHTYMVRTDCLSVYFG